MRVGILGCGGIANVMANTLKQMGNVARCAIAARDLARAQAFAEKWGFEKAYGSYEAMLDDGNVDLVYIAVPHSHHHHWTIAALEAGKHVLCEKAFAANAAQAAEMIALSERKGLLLTEAIWPRYMPSRRLIDEVIRRGDIGEVVSVSSNLGYRIDRNERLYRPELAGGCLLDLTVYTLNFSSMVLGNDIRRISASMVPTATGVDGQDAVMLEYAGGQMATMFTTMYALTDRRGLICGRDGMIVVDNINNPERIRVYTAAGLSGPCKEVPVPKQLTGYEYEVMACERAIAAGQVECPEMPHAETLEIMRQMDAIRAQFGIVFPFERG